MNLRFDDRFVRELPGDPVAENRVRQVRGACHSRVVPTPVVAPSTVAWSDEAAALVGLDADACRSPQFAQTFAGNSVLPGMIPYAACYGGHQFGSWAGQLGDGRAITLGEAIGPDDRRWELQLKGAGRTPYSRSGDGRAVMRSSVREFLCSEAMHHLGVPTTRALSLVATGEQVVRDMFYDGNPQVEPGAVVCRVAPTFLRFGNYEILASRGETDLLRALADHTIRTHFPELPAGDYGRWFDEVCRRTALMVTGWMRVGFVHGVMNTDNMSILGLTIDYGPYGWLEGYDPGWTPNTTDASGRRYRYGAQPQVALWNLVQFGNAIAPLVDAVEPLEEALHACAKQLENDQHAMLLGKLGLAPGDDPDGDAALVEGLSALFAATETDMTIFFRALGDVDQLANDDAVTPLDDAFYAPPDRARLAGWLRRYLDRAAREGVSHPERRARMNAVNPKYVLRNYLAQLAIDRAEKGDPTGVVELLDVLRRPYDHQPGREEFARKRPEWARHRAGCSMLSCSS